MTLGKNICPDNNYASVINCIVFCSLFFVHTFQTNNIRIVLVSNLPRHGFGNDS